MNKSKNSQAESFLILNISSDTTILGIIMIVIFSIFDQEINLRNAMITINCLATFAVWKIISPFSENFSWSLRYLQAILLIIGSAGIIALSMWLKPN